MKILKTITSPPKYRVEFHFAKKKKKTFDIKGHSFMVNDRDFPTPDLGAEYRPLPN